MSNESQQTYSEIDFDSISTDLDFQINKKCGQIIQKGIFPTGMNRGIRVYVHTGDHMPIHFHVKSSQRYLNAKFQLDPLRLLENKTAIPLEMDEKFILKYFAKNNHLLKDIRKKFMELNPELEYGK
ncbi:MAG: hypothetical protein BWY19_00742 [bacterium ADurb.Bin212]|nr:MAG: hypothetical protein BWY19_00742 [bacterium ADurb.Bin212]